MTFDFFVANGNENSNGNNPLYLYAISTDSNPAVVGNDDATESEDNYLRQRGLFGHFCFRADGSERQCGPDSGPDFGDNGKGGVPGTCPNTNNNSGSFTGNFDQNNAGTRLASRFVVGTSACANPALHVRFDERQHRTVHLLHAGNTRSDNRAVLPIPFVLYASGANRGFLLDQSSSSVMTGTMNSRLHPSGTRVLCQSNGSWHVRGGDRAAIALPVASGCTVAHLVLRDMNLVLTSSGSSTFSILRRDNSRAIGRIRNYDGQLSSTLGGSNPRDSESRQLRSDGDNTQLHDLRVTTTKLASSSTSTTACSARSFTWRSRIAYCPRSTVFAVARLSKRS